jgi:uncharacterized protein YfaS (alpha-2-macroglobulin family)
MQRFLLFCNAVLAVLLAVSLWSGSQQSTVHAGSTANAGWSEESVRVRPVVDERDGARRVRGLTVDFGAALAACPDAQGTVRVDTAALGLKLDPPFDYVAYWQSADSILLAFADDLPPAKRVRVAFSRALLSNGGEVLREGVVREVVTPGARLVDVVIDELGMPGGAPCAKLALYFDMSVPTDALRKLLQVVDLDSGARIECDLNQVEGAADGLSFVAALHAAELPRRVDVQVAAGLPTIGGEVVAPVGSSQTVTMTEDLEIVTVLGRAGGIDVRCNRKVPLPVAGLLRVEPSLPFQLRRQSRGLRLLGEFVPGEVYTLIFDAGFPGEGPNRLRRPMRRSLVIPDRPQDLDFEHGGKVLCASAEPSIVIGGCNVPAVRVAVQRVHDNNVLRAMQRFDSTLLAAGVERVLQIEAARNVEWTREIDLAEFVEGEPRGLYRIEIAADEPYGRTRSRLVQVTDLGVTLRAGLGSAAVQVVDLATGLAVGGAAVELLSATNQTLARGTTQESGLLLLDWPALVVPPRGRIGVDREQQCAIVRVQSGADRAVLSLTEHAVELADEGLDGRRLHRDALDAWVWPGRGIVRPGETMECALLCRDTRSVATAGRRLEVEWVQPTGSVAARQQFATDGAGAAFLRWPVPVDAPTGAWTVRVRDLADAGDALVVGKAAFVVDAFVPNRLEAEILAVEPLRFARTAMVRIRANWLDGAPAAGRPVVLRTRLLAPKASLPGHEGFSFAGEDEGAPPGELRQIEGVLDSQGEAELPVVMPPEARQQILTAHLLVEVLDPSGRPVRAATQQQVLRPQEHLAVRSSSGVVDVRVLDPDGQPVDTDREVTLRLEERRWDWRPVALGGDRWRWQTEVERTTLREWQQALVAGSASVPIDQQANEGWLVVVATMGERTVEQAVSDAPARPDRLRVRSVDAAVAAGSKARIEVVAPAAARGYVTVETDAVIAAEVVQLERGRNLVEVGLPPGIEEPNVHVVVTATRAVPQSGAGQGPAWILGAAPVAVDRSAVVLQPTLGVPDEVLPGAELVVSLSAAGAGTGMVFVVDEGVLGVTQHLSPDPTAHFLARRALTTDGADLGVALLQQMSFRKGTKSGGDGSGGGLAALLAGSINTRIRPLAMAASVVLDDEGHGRVAFALPEYEGRVRVMAVVAGANGCGSCSEDVVVRAPLGLSASAPRMLTPGDRFTLPVTLKNATGRAAEVALVAKVAGATAVSDTERAIALPADGSATVELEATVGAAAREVVCDFTARCGDHQRTLRLHVPVRRADVHRREDLGFDLRQGGEFVVDAGWSEVRCVLRADRDPDAQLAPLLQQLVVYPYGCLEQTTSKGLGLLTCQALLPRIYPADATLPTEVPALVQAAVDRILSMQQRRGGFGWWPAADTEYGYGTVHALDFLVAARDRGFAVHERALAAGLDRLARIATKSGDIRLRAHAVEVLSRAGRPVQPTLDWLATQVTGVEGRARLAIAYATCDRLDAAAALLREDPEWPASRGGDSLLESPLRAQAFWLRARQAIAADDPELPTLAAALLRALLGSPVTTQETSQGLRALAGYYAAMPRGSGQDGLPIRGDVDGQPFSFLGQGTLELRAGSVVRLAKGGGGFLLLSLEGRGVPRSAESGELAVERSMIDVETGQPVDQVRRGRIYEVRIRGRSIRPLANLLFTDLLPAGLEPEPAAAGWQPQVAAGECRPDHVERRDDRVLLFHSGDLPREFELRHRVRAVFPGDYHQPALVVEAMYDPTVRVVVAAEGTLEVSR